MDRKKLRDEIFDVLQDHVVWSFVPSDSEKSQEQELYKASESIVDIFVNLLDKLHDDLEVMEEDDNGVFDWYIDIDDLVTYIDNLRIYA